MVGHVLTLSLFTYMFILNVPLNHCRPGGEKRLGSFLFQIEETLKVANHSLEAMTKQMGFDTSSLILNANLSIYALAQVLLFQNLFSGHLIFFFFKFCSLNSVVPILATKGIQILLQK